MGVMVHSRHVVIPDVVRVRTARGAAAPALLTDLIAYWTLNETSGNRNDAHTNGLTLTDNNTVGYAAGKQDYAAAFVAANSEYLSRASSAALQCGGSSITFALWVYLITAGERELVSKDTDTSREYTLALSGLQALFYINGSLIAITPPSSISTGVWHFLVGWWSSVDQKTHIQLDNGTVYDSGATDIPNNGGAEFQIGARQYPGYMDYHNGYIDEVGFWKRILTAEEKTALYNSGSGVTYPFTGI